MQALAVNRGWNEYDAPHRDLRELLDRVERAGELTHIAHADWNLEIGTLIEIVYNKLQNNPPAILFEDIAGYSKGIPSSFGHDEFGQTIGADAGLSGS